MTITFEPGDGSFEIVLDADEKLPEEWNRSGVNVLRKSEDGYKVVKSEIEEIEN